MAHMSPRSWSEVERFNVSFEAVASGWQDGEPNRVAESISRALSRELRIDEEFAEPGRLFLSGSLGYLKRSEATGVLRAAARAVGLRGALRVRQRAQLPRGSFVRMEQHIRGKPIYGSDLSLHIDQDGAGYAITGSILPPKMPLRQIKRAIRPQEAIDIVFEALKLHRHNSQDESAQVREVLLPTPETLLPCYHVQLFTWEPFGTWYGFVRKDGELLALYNVASSAAAQVYRANPLRGDVVRVSLRDLKEPLLHLEGPYGQVWEHGGGRVRAMSGGFIYTPDRREFDQPQLFYFLGECRDAAGALVVSEISDSARFNPIVGYVHVDEAVNNAYFDPGTGALYFGNVQLDEEQRYTSRSLDIVLHEFGHAVSDAICRLGRSSSNTQSRAMSEGYSDYLACTTLDNPIVGDYFMGRAEGFRTCDNERQFPPGFAGEEHSVGEVWAGLLWSLRTHSEMGKAVTDAVATQSLTYMGPWRSIVQGVEALIEADRRLYPGEGGRGQHESVIRGEFDRRKP